MLAKDRKSTRLNSSHSQISYAVFCLKRPGDHRDLHSFPTRRSSDLSGRRPRRCAATASARRSITKGDFRRGCRRRSRWRAWMRGWPDSAVSVEQRRLGYRRLDAGERSEEHTSELQSQSNLVCRLLLETTRRPPRSPLFPYTTLFRSFRAAAAAMRRHGIGATFHYEGGLQARLPTTVEMACLDAWLAGLSGERGAAASGVPSP